MTAFVRVAHGRRRGRVAQRAALGGLALSLAVLLSALAGPPPVRAAEGLTMEVRTLLGGHARVGTWLAIEVALRNDGPPIRGELRITGGVQGTTSYGTLVDLPTTSNQLHVLYAQPPAFGRQIEISLFDAGAAQAVASQRAQFVPVDPGRMVIGILAERPQGIAGGLRVLTDPNAQPPLIVPLTVADLPERPEAWTILDRLVWQDIDAAALSVGQLEALGAWTAGGGRLSIVGGTTGAGALAALPDDLVPYRPTATADVAPASLRGILGEIPGDASDVVALVGDTARGRVLARSGERIVAAEAAYGSGTVTLLGFDPTVGWIAESAAGNPLWRRLVPARTGPTGPVITGDDSNMLSALTNLPSLALPPIGGLLALLAGYIVLIGPANYLVLRRLDRREWAWLTMPVLIVVFAAGSYGFGFALRGSEVLVNQAAIVRGGPDSTRGLAQVYVGVFSPNRSTYQVRIPGGALLSAPASGESFGFQGGTGRLDILQGDPARVRNLAVGFGSFRTVRADTPAALPRVTAELRLVGDRLEGTVRNHSDQTLEKAAIAFGNGAMGLGTLLPGGEAKVSMAAGGPFNGQTLADRIIGPVFFEGGNAGAEVRRSAVRQSLLNQVTFDPFFGFGTLQADGPVFLAFGSEPIVDVEIEGQVPRRSGDVLYYVPLPMTVRGEAVFRPDLIRSSVVSVDAPFFNKDPWSLNFGQGSITLDYRPIPFEGSFRARRLVLGMGFGPELVIPPRGGEVVIPEPAPACPKGADCPEPVPNFDGLPEVELFDIAAGDWTRLPHLANGRTAEVDQPSRFVDPETGAVLIRFVNDRQDGVGFQFQVHIEGSVA